MGDYWGDEVSHEFCKRSLLCMLERRVSQYRCTARLDEGRRGILIEKDLNLATAKVREAIYNENLLSMSIACQKWSNKYTLDRFEGEIKKLLSKE